MHIALCDDNVADRKQFERLIKRESDRRLANAEPFFMDSFGNADSLLANPMQYDVFYIDMCKTSPTAALDIVTALRNKGVPALIIMCCSDIDYREQSFPGNISFLDKPIRAEELTKSLDAAYALKEQAVPLIEIRVENKTHYFTEPDILYAVEHNRLLDVVLLNGEVITIPDSAQNLFSQLEAFRTFFAPGNKIVLNGRYIEKLKFGKALMKNGKSFRISHGCMAYAKKMYEEFHIS